MNDREHRDEGVMIAVVIAMVLLLVLAGGGAWYLQIFSRWSSVSWMIGGLSFTTTLPGFPTMTTPTVSDAPNHRRLSEVRLAPRPVAELP